MSLTYFCPGQIIDLKLYALGGFSLPFLSIGTYAIAASLMFCLTVPQLEAVEDDEKKCLTDANKSVSFRSLFMVSIYYCMLQSKFAIKVGL